MKKFLTYIVLSVLPYFLSAQTRDNFEDDNFVNPIWKGDTASFVHEFGKLRSNNSTSNASFFIGTEIQTESSTEWRMQVHLFVSTSSKNLVQWVLTGDHLNPDSLKNGMYVVVGDTKDHLSFWTVKNGAPTMLFASEDKSIANSESDTKLKVIQTEDSMCYLYADFTAQNEWVFIGKARGMVLAKSSFSVVSVSQSTSSFFLKHYFDNFYVGPRIQDTIAPEVVSVDTASGTQLLVKFNEAMDSISLSTPSNYAIEAESPLTAKVQSSREVLLTFATTFKNPSENIIKIGEVKDTSNNALRDTSILFNYVRPFAPVLHSLLITEIMVKPSGLLALPKAPYIEIYNATSDPISLQNISIGDHSGTKDLPNRVLYAQEYAILCAGKDSADFAAFGKVLPMAGLPTLNSTKDRLRLYAYHTQIIHEVAYETSILPAEKEEGWSLEMVDVQNPCHFLGNWLPCISRDGGTPGMVNSVSAANPDQQVPKIESAFVLDASTVVVTFSETLDRVTVLDKCVFTLLGISMDANKIAPTDSLNTFLLFFDAPFVPNEVHLLQVSDAMDCVGNVHPLDTIRIGLVGEPSYGDLRINEILYDPYDGGSEFIEVYNTSNKILNLGEIRIAKKENGVYKDLVFLTGSNTAIFPSSYTVLTKSIANQEAFYTSIDASALVETELPTLPNDGATLVLLDKYNSLVDSVSYAPTWHFEALKEEKGVSLEKIDVMGRNYANNWTSAASIQGFATPGLANSQSAMPLVSSGSIVLLEPHFSPNGDGNNDRLQLSYSFGSPNITASIYIFNEYGMLVHTLMKNETLAQSGMVSWDGVNETGVLSSIGLYTVLVEYVDPVGKVYKEKVSCALVK